MQDLDEPGNQGDFGYMYNGNGQFLREVRLIG